jgi:tRNA A-37 threonylcarbamoyl transferase component Bud32
MSVLLRPGLASLSAALRPPSQLSAVVADWRQTRTPDAAGFLAHHPDLASDRSAVLYLAYEDFCLRENAGEFERGECDLETFVARFPTPRRQVRMLHLHLFAGANADLLAELSDSTREAVWPEAGQTFLGFHLVRELGRGSFARVFLAHEPAAGNRTVALKVSRRGSAEVRTLGRLRHANIVHVNSVAEDEATGFVAVCMEFVDGVSLADALRWAFAQGSPPRASVFVAEAAPGPGLAEMPYAEGCVRLAAQMADALAYAHRAGIVHGDLKPANVILRADGRPVLIDFNLAFDTRAGDGCAGGTLAYMAPSCSLPRCRRTSVLRPRPSARRRGAA